MLDDVRIATMRQLGGATASWLLAVMIGSCSPTQVALARHHDTAMDPRGDLRYASTTMSRSIHDTHGVALREWMKASATGSELDLHRAKAARNNIATQRRLKKLVRQRRRRSDPAVQVDASATPIIERDAGAYVRHPASAEDLREILRRLPGRFDGLARIELCLGGRARGKRSSPDVDPHTGSPGYELLPGVFAPEVRGYYRERDGALRLHAYVYAGELAPFIAMYLRRREPRAHWRARRPQPRVPRARSPRRINYLHSFQL